MIGKIFPRKLNKEAEISLIKPDEMMDALNVLASGGEGNDASLVKKAHGNIEALANDGANLFQDEGGNSEDVIGQVVDESSQRIYYFTKGASSESVYLAEQLDENNIKITLLLRDFDLGFDRYVAADIIKTPKKDISFLTSDGTFSGESGDTTDIFDFQFEDDSTTVVENQTFIIVTAPPNFITSPIYDGSEKTFFGQLSVKNIGSEAGEVTVTTTITSGNLDNVFFQFDSTSTSTVTLNLSSNQTAVIPFRAIIAANVAPEDNVYAFNFLVEETPGPNNPNPLNVDYDRSIALQFLTPSYPVQIKVTPGALTSGLEGDPSNISIVEALANPAGSSDGLLAGIQTPETAFTSSLGLLTIEVQIQSELDAGNFLPEMSLRIGAAGGTDGDYEGSNTGLYTDQSQIVVDNLAPSNSVNIDLSPSDFTGSPGGKTATKLVYVGRQWDTNNLEGVTVTQTISVNVINGETGTTFGLVTFDSDLGESVAQDDAPFYAISYTNVQYTIANVPTPVSVISLNGAVDESLGLDSRVYSATEDALVGGSSDQFSFQVVNTGESDGYFNISIDPMVSAHAQARQYAFGTTNFPFINGAGISPILKSWYTGMEVDYVVNNPDTQTSVLTGNTKPNFIKTFTDNEPTYGTGSPFNFFEFRDGLPGEASFTGFAWHASEADQSWVSIPAGAQATVTIRMSNLTQGVYPIFPTAESGFGVWEAGFSPLESNGAAANNAKTAIVFPKKNNQGIGPSFLFENYDEFRANKPLPFLTDGLDAGNFMGDTTSSNDNAKEDLLAAPIWKDILSKIYIQSSPTGSFDDASIVGAGGFKVTTVETVQPELLVFANGNYAHNTALAVVGYETSTNVSTPIINSYFPIQYPQEPNGGFATIPPVTIANANENTSDNTVGNFISEILANPYSEDAPVTESQAQGVLLNHYGRQNGLPIHLGFYCASMLAGGPSPTIELTASTPANLVGNVGAYSPFGPHNPTVVSTPGGPSNLSGSIGTGYVCTYATGDNMFAPNESSGAGDLLYTTNQAGIVMSEILAPNGIYSGSPTLVQSPETPAIAYENSFFGATPNHGRFRRLTLTMAPGSFLTVQPSHMLAYFYDGAGQLDPQANTSSLSETIGYTVKHTIIASGFRNEDAFANGNNELCLEQVHSKQSLFEFHATGNPPAGGGIDVDFEIPVLGSPPPIPEVSERGSTVGDEDEAAETPTAAVSLNLPADRRADERIEDQVKMADSLRRSGVSPNKKKRY